MKTRHIVFFARLYQGTSCFSKAMKKSLLHKGDGEKKVFLPFPAVCFLHLPAFSALHRLPKANEHPKNLHLAEVAVGQNPVPPMNPRKPLKKTIVGW